MDANHVNLEHIPEPAARNNPRPTSCSRPSPTNHTCYLKSGNSSSLSSNGGKDGGCLCSDTLTGLIRVGIGERADPFVALNSLLHDIETGKRASVLRAPQNYRKSMVSLSDKAMIPTSISPRKPQAPNPVETPEGELVTFFLDTNPPWSATVPSYQGSGSLGRNGSSVSVPFPSPSFDPKIGLDSADKSLPSQEAQVR